MKQPQLSVIIPVYNTADSIKNMVTGVLNQSFTDIELILVDDGSTDTTREILDQVADIDDRVVVLSKKNGGPSSARNAGIRKAAGKYIVFLDADDYLMPGAFSVLVKEIKNGHQMVAAGWEIDLQTKKRLISRYKVIHPQPATISGESLHVRKEVVKSIGGGGELYNLWNKIFIREIIINNGLLFEESIRFGEDLLFILSYTKFCDSIRIVPELVYRYRSGLDTSTFKKSSLVPKYRDKNDKELGLYTADFNDAELVALTDWVRWRWLLSYYLLVCGSTKGFREKIHLLWSYPKGDFIKPDGLRHIGYKKFIIELFVATIKFSPYVTFITIYPLYIARKLYMLVKISALRSRQRLTS